MAGYENIRRRWISAFSSSGVFSGVGSGTEPSRRWSTARGLDWDTGSLLHASSRSSAARMPARVHPRPVAVPTTSTALDRRVVINDEIFRDVLVRERNRAERFGEPFVVLLLGLEEPASPYAAAVWSQAIAAVTAVVRETDVVGWVNRGQALGVILTEMGASDKSIAREFEARIRRELTDRLDTRTLAGLSLRLHFNMQSDKKSAGDTLWPSDPLLFKLKAEDDSTSLRDVLKRGVDILGSAALLLLLSPVFLVIAVLIKLKSPGPIFFRQVRVGQKAKPFTMLKFRSMHVNADSKVHQQYVTQFIKSGAQNDPGKNQVFKLTNDPRITALGHILRKTSLDELPQLWNVLRGDMSLVGPRPPLFYETEQYAAWHWRRVLDAKPGVTGLWQVAGRSRTTFDGMVRLDLRYVRTRSLWTDIKILLATPAAVIAGKGAC
jgi:lipopolysaccharide/colanic/teichoic acid biosynthesis glycosyltransferase